MKIIAEDLWFPEGPVWMGDGSLLVVEIRRRTLTRLWLDGRPRRYYPLGGGPNGAAIGPDGCCYVCNNGGIGYTQRGDGVWISTGQAADYQGGFIQKVDLDSGESMVLYDRAGIEPLRGPNDLVFDAHGGFYFTDPGKVRMRDWDKGCVCYAMADGSSIQQVIFPIHKPNGIGLSPDGRTLYVSETETARVLAWRVVAPGKLAPLPGDEPRPVHHGKLVYVSPHYVRLDSLALENTGRVCVGTLETGGITAIEPSTGAAEFRKLPDDPHCTNLCFGGPGLSQAFITQSHLGRVIQVDWPRPGQALHYAAESESGAT
ncbi:SMP-30/gluconolactonase/LRE family protein [Achromobacter piechaudii]|uniref:SMP-30/Gluconolactonase/LRE-like region domain-containing protein n=1 Tax=Achromobacter piechaudii TaxID=72556 RepID=A0A6S7DUW2_9BURK|nr:SMP-30/gluconolactonase/LRE family protein [Achromobacter piechaudii]CAB3867519.1 hypothetical protein LMG1861_02589 [Achromobacter piechaudii]